MKHSIYVDQLVLEYWKGKIDTCDCFLLALIQDLNPDNPAISRVMWKGHFLLTLKWIQEQLPMIQISESTVYRRLRHLAELGILESIQKKRQGFTDLTYYRLSRLFWKIHNTRHEKATEAAKRAAIQQAQQPTTNPSHTCTGANATPQDTLAFDVNRTCTHASNESIRDSTGVRL